MKTKSGVALYSLMFAGLMTAMNVLLGKFLVINIGDIGRISLSSIPVLLCGCAFGPVWGGAVGFTGDLLGCFLRGYAVNPIILVGSTLLGVIPGLFRWEWLKDAKLLRFFGLVAASVVPTSGIVKTVGLKIFYRTPVKALLAARLPVILIEVPVVALVLMSLIGHPEVMSMIEKARGFKRKGAKGRDRKRSD